MWLGPGKKSQQNATKYCQILISELHQLSSAHNEWPGFLFDWPGAAPDSVSACVLGCSSVEKEREREREKDDSGTERGERARALDLFD
jgi:hypothetical protein